MRTLYLDCGMGAAGDMLAAACDKLGVPVVVMETIQFGFSMSIVRQWPGCPNINTRTFIDYIYDIVASVIEMGFEKVVLLDFYADWCGPCRMVSPLVDEIAEENPQYLVCKVNVDNAPELAQAFGIVSIPTLVVLKNGAIASQAVGARSKEQILELLK